MQWYTRMGRRVWPFEIYNFVVRDRRASSGPTVEELWGAPQASEERSMVRLRVPKRRVPQAVGEPAATAAVDAPMPAQGLTFA
jgi:anaerobic magnesium-protoporphyrin IX monomethyl ester cyclase